MKERIRRFMDEPLTMRRSLKLTAITSVAVLAVGAVLYGVNKAQEAWLEHEWGKKNLNDTYVDDE